MTYKPGAYRTRFVQRDPLRTRMQRGDTLVGSFVFLPSPSIIEILAEAGLDFFLLDLEHSPKNWETVENMVRAADIYGLPVIVRVPENTPQAILQALEVGAAGVAVPFIETADDVQRATRAARYAPEGERGTCTQTRAARHGAFRKAYVEYADAQNREIAVIGLIENQRGVSNIDAILAVPNGLDAVLLGRADLASDLGKPGQSGDPVVVDAVDVVLEAIRRAAANHPTGRSACAAMAIYGPSDVARWKERGCSIFMAPSESSMLYEAASAWRAGVVQAAEATQKPERS
ncbi:HpcH/HpaI aldolase/citrate lyase family protein [Hydrogenophaga sp.]|uniref:HpcH/HpaI aldolase family protein n=1 Tax=Hydrogenophaga sp. TaxID=1904254 RepID=UPI002722F2AE|nr:aldolase/citrate lyase family protein [Hydrogenophaga sp.]MDO9438884.1 aldolase/citrate lyase family protein [Hydrogenophaga sp.]